ncbi:MAG: hypothetical protein IJU84_05320 [Clostridia bacterium]|nr:hypothetical protein [Clostridia bacterium]MBQ9481561.1 hypothetical protein [Clostridia bacterium]
MSFFSNYQSDKCPGTISGNPLNGLNEKICIQVKRVFDACIRQERQDDVGITLYDFFPANPTYPLTFTSARSTTTSGIISNLGVDRLADRQNCARVQATVTIPIEVLYTDANGVEGIAKSQITVNEDVILFVPQPSIMPYAVEAVVSFVAPEGTYVNETTMNVSGCLTVILKVVMEVELLVPSYGYCAIPPCQEYTHEVCTGFFELPLYPQGANNIPQQNR